MPLKTIDEMSEEVNTTVVHIGRLNVPERIKKINKLHRQEHQCLGKVEVYSNASLKGPGYTFNNFLTLFLKTAQSYLF